MTEDEPLWQSEDDRPYIALIVLTPLVLVAAYYILFGVVLSSDRYYQVNTLVLYFILCWPVAWSYSIFYLLRERPPVFYRDRIELYRRSGQRLRTYYYRDMTGWSLTYHKMKYGGSLGGTKSGIYIEFADWDTTVPDQGDKLEQLLTGMGAPRLGHFHVQRGSAMIAVGVTVAVLMMLAVIGMLVHTGYGPVYIRDHAKGIATHRLQIVLNRPPDSVAGQITAHGLGEFVWTGMADRLWNVTSDSIHNGDTVDIDILQYDYEVKIAGTRPSTWLDRHIGWREIAVIGAYYTNGDSIPRW